MVVAGTWSDPLHRLVASGVPEHDQKLLSGNLGRRAGQHDPFVLRVSSAAGERRVATPLRGEDEGAVVDLCRRSTGDSAKEREDPRPRVKEGNYRGASKTGTEKTEVPEGAVKVDKVPKSLGQRDLTPTCRNPSTLKRSWFWQEGLSLSVGEGRLDPSEPLGLLVPRV